MKEQGSKKQVGTFRPPEMPPFPREVAGEEVMQLAKVTEVTVTLLNNTLPSECAGVRGCRNTGLVPGLPIMFLLLFLSLIRPFFCLLYTIISTPLLMNSVVITSSPQAANKLFAWNTDSCLLPQWTKLGENTKESQIKIMRETGVSSPSQMYLSICFSVTFQTLPFHIVNKITLLCGNCFAFYIPPRQKSQTIPTYLYRFPFRNHPHLVS